MFYRSDPLLLISLVKAALAVIGAIFHSHRLSLGRGFHLFLGIYGRILGAESMSWAEVDFARLT